MLRLLSFIAILALAGCAGTAQPTSVSDKGTTIRNKIGVETAEEIQGQANEICRRYGKTARFTGNREVPSDPFYQYSSFDCVIR